MHGLRVLAIKNHGTPLHYFPEDYDHLNGDLKAADKANEQWVTDLLTAAAQLEEYLEDDWFNAQLGKQAMHWVADNLSALWD